MSFPRLNFRSCICPSGKGHIHFTLVAKFWKLSLRKVILCKITSDILFISMLSFFFSSVHLQEVYPFWNWDWNIVSINIACATLLSAKTNPNQALRTSYERFLLNPTRDSSKYRWSKESSGCSVSHPTCTSVWEAGRTSHLKWCYGFASYLWEWGQMQEMKEFGEGH